MIDLLKHESFIQDYSSYLKFELGLSTNTLNAYLSDIKKFLLYLNGRNINHKLFHEYNKELENLGLSASTRTRYQSSIINYLKWLNLSYKKSFDIDKFNFDISQSSTLPDVLSIDEINSMINSYDTSSYIAQRNSLIIETMYSTACRVSELCKMKLGDVDFDRKVIKIIGKGGKSRIVPLGSYLEKKILKYLAAREDKNIDSPYLILSKTSKQIDRTAIFRIVKKCAMTENISKNIHPHTIRHSAATHMLEGGCDLRLIQEFLGHSSITTTQIYTKISGQHMIEVYKETHPRS